jgi:tryptophan-rich sensory protein
LNGIKRKNIISSIVAVGTGDIVDTLAVTTGIWLSILFGLSAKIGWDLYRKKRAAQVIVQLYGIIVLFNQLRYVVVVDLHNKTGNLLRQLLIEQIATVYIEKTINLNRYIYYALLLFPPLDVTLTDVTELTSRAPTLNTVLDTLILVFFYSPLYWEK